MANELSQIEAWLYDLLTGDTELAAAVEGRVFADAAPKGTAFPFIVFNHYWGRDTDTMNRLRLLTRQTYQVKVVTAGQNSSKEIADRIDELLQLAVNVEFEGYCYNSFRLRPIKLTLHDAERAYSHLGGLYEIQTYELSAPEPPPEEDYVLDPLPAAVGAWGFRRLLASWTNSAIRVRRSSDFTETDIGFSGEDLDTTGLLAFCGGGNGFVVTIYDQSGNGRHLTQADATLQPKIVTSGVVDGFGAKPAPLFAGHYLRYSGAFPTVSRLHHQGVAKIVIPGNTATFRRLVAMTALLQNDFSDLGHMLADRRDAGQFQAWAKNVNSPKSNTTNPTLYGLRISASEIVASADGVDGSTTTFTTPYTLNQWTELTFGGYGVADNRFSGYLPEYVLWPDYLSSGDAAAYRANVQAYWGTA